MRDSFIKASFLLVLLVAALGIGGAECIQLLTGGPGEEGPATGNLTGTVTDSATNTPILNVQIVVGDKSVLTNVSGKYNVSDLEVGTYQITGKKIGYADYTKTIDIIEGDNLHDFQLTPTVESVEVTPTSATINVGGTLPVTATVTYGNGSTDSDVSWSSSDEDIATVSSSGEVTGEAAGSAAITATSNKDTTKSGSATITVVVSTPTPTPTPTVSPTPTPTPTLSLDKTSLNIIKGSSDTISVTAKKSDGTDDTISATSANTSIASVSVSGKVVTVNGVATGATTLTVSSGSGLQATAGVTVSVGSLVSISVTPNPTTVASGSTKQFSAEGKDSFNNTVVVAPTWSVTGVIGTITTGGLFTAVTSGSGTVVATSGSVSGSANVTVTVGPAASISLFSGNNQSATVGTTLANPFVVIVRDANNNPVSGVSVTFAVTAGGGSLSASSASTGTDGKASTTLTLGPTTGTNTVTATSTGLSPVAFNATGSLAIITATAGANGAIAPSGAVAVNGGSNQTFTITPNTGYNVANVLVDGVSVGATTSYTFTNVTANHTISASFAIATYSLTVAKSGLGSGTVTSSPVGIDCGADCSEVYNYGTVVTLTATASLSYGSTFAGWSGACTGTGSCIATMDGAKSATAAFTAATVSTYAGDGTAGFNDGATSSARFSDPSGVAVDSSGNVYVADPGNHRIRVITPAGVVSTFAGDGTFGFNDGATSSAQFNLPRGVAVDSSGNVYVADSFNHRIRKITSGGVVSTLAGIGTAGFTDGATSSAQFNVPFGVAVDSSGNVYVADRNNHRIRKISGGVVSTLAGSGTAEFNDGATSSAQFNFPRGVAVDSSGNVYVADLGNHRIRKISGGVVSTLAGDGTAGYLDGTGTAARFNFPNGVAVDSSGNVYVADQSNHRIRVITPAGVVSTLAGDGTQSYLDGTGTAARFNFPFGVAVDSSGNVYVAEIGNDLIRKITP